MRAFHGHRSRDKRQRTRAFRGAASQNKAALFLVAVFFAETVFRVLRDDERAV